MKKHFFILPSFLLDFKTSSFSLTYLPGLKLLEISWLRVPKIWKTKDEMSKRLVASKIRIIIWALGC
jgi:hypothetical protein